ncbi:uncharacterized protein LOC108253664 [Diaphorina citri]|jgi:Reverse transcriptase (RNA-dependent DNA polymerase).|uniref:Uncharacterized protein LOC108253664 n=1 Tax=Diaphorina citri TaxID=121845 RepID=A0A1S4EMX0_DIACI|nr:uncharacterized protein LOC108253664 [Diaphorina citri]KAI5746374.1 hypothetical protein M8J77_002946 [Diaphorina citri]
MINRPNLKATTKVTQRCIQDLMFADDCALVAKSPKDLQIFLNLFAHTAKQYGLIIDKGKTKCMFVNTTEANIKIDDTILENVSSFKYLGSHITNTGESNAEVEDRICAANKAFGSLYHKVWKT